MIKTYYYYTLEEVMTPAVNRPLRDLLHNNVTQPYFKDVIEEFYSEVPNWAKSNGADFNYLNELWERIRHIFKRDDYFFFISETEYDLTTDAGLRALKNEAKNRAVDFFETIYESKDKYIELIKQQANLKSNMLADIETSRKDWFNDTPETYDSGGITYTADDFNTNYNHSTSYESIGTMADKLEMVEKAMNDYYDNWVREFRKFIIIYN